MGKRENRAQPLTFSLAGPVVADGMKVPNRVQVIYPERNNGALTGVEGLSGRSTDQNPADRACGRPRAVVVGELVSVSGEEAVKSCVVGHGCILGSIHTRDAADPGKAIRCTYCWVYLQHCCLSSAQCLLYPHSRPDVAEPRFLP